MRSIATKWIAKWLAKWLALSVLVISFAATAAQAENWVTSWAASVQGPYPVGNPSAQPNLSLAFPSAE